jgi:cell division septation protein DedD
MKLLNLITLTVAILLSTGCIRENTNAIPYDSFATLSALPVEDTVKKTDVTSPSPVFSKKEQMEYETYLTLVDKDTLDPAIPLIEEKQYKFIVQLACVTDFERLQTEQQRLKAQGYETTISKRFSNGIAYYRLRLNGIYSQSEAKTLGQEIVRKFSTIKDYIFLQVN